MNIYNKKNQVIATKKEPLFKKPKLLDILFIGSFVCLFLLLAWLDFIGVI